MHPNPAFRKTSRAGNIAFARDRGFGILTIAGPDGPLVSHVPFVLDEDGIRWEAHLVRSNPIVHALEEPRPALVAVSGPDGYVSPDWYGIADQVPTWNYVAVHLRGSLRRLPDSDLPVHAARLASTFESRLAPKQPWTEAKMDPDALERLRRMIVPVALDISSIDGTWKLTQNKSAEARLAAAEEIGSSGIGAELGALAALMRDPPPET